MLWRLPAPVRSFLASDCRRYSSTTAKTADPLRILFCGSDEFSIASLRALSQAKREVPRLIDSIDVVHRPAKPTGRGLKALREGNLAPHYADTSVDSELVPIQAVATEELGLNTHVIDTFTGWKPPVHVDLVIAVSFGLFVPPRILNLAKYGGLNVHPSLLPDLRGPAPIHHALLKGRTYTGVSVQTLHPKHFDRGVVLAQTNPGIQINLGTTPANLTGKLGEQGAKMLVDVIKSRAFVPPLKDVGWYGKSGEPIDHAEKITKQHKYIDFSKASLEDILTIQRVLGEPWCLLPNGERLILNKVNETEMTDECNHKPGLWVQAGIKTPVAKAACGRIVSIEQSTYPGTKTGQGNARLLRILSAEGSDERLD